MHGPDAESPLLRTTWGDWGAEDEVGALNFLDPRAVIDAARLIRSGRTFTLGMEVFGARSGPVSPEHPEATRVVHRDWSHYAAGQVPIVAGRPRSVDDGLVISTHATTHVDALGHLYVDETLYNGFPAQSTFPSMQRADVSALAIRGIVGRAVLLDIARRRGVPYLERDAEIRLADLLDAAAAQDVELMPHDILLLHTGSIARFFAEGGDAFFADYSEPGLSDDPELLAWVDSLKPTCLGSDTLSNELPRSPRSGEEYPLHRLLMRNRGIVFQDALWLSDLAAGCAENRSYEGLYVCSPLKLVGMSASPVNPIFIQ